MHISFKNKLIFSGCKFWLPLLLANLYSLFALSQPSRINSLNFSSFSKAHQANLSSEKEYAIKNSGHPDYGQLPSRNAPCIDCFEDLSQRTADSRIFIKESAQGKTTYNQFAAGALNFLDGSNHWREINPDLRFINEGKFMADRQPVPVEIDLNNHWTILHIKGERYIFNKGVCESETKDARFCKNDLFWIII